MPTLRSHPRDLVSAHTPDAIRERIQAATRHPYLRDFVFGAIDGSVTTFAVVSGVEGASLDGRIAMILGLANLLADGFSMATSNFLSSRTDLHRIEKARRIEEHHIDTVPEGEREEVRQIYAAKGFSGETLEEIVRVITEDRHQWVNTMITEEHGLSLDVPSPFRAAVMTFVAFMVFGAIPLLPFLFRTGWDRTTAFYVASAGTALSFVAIGWVKGYVLERQRWLAAAETLLFGSLAAALAWIVGWYFRH